MSVENYPRLVYHEGSDLPPVSDFQIIFSNDNGRLGVHLDRANERHVFSDTDDIENLKEDIASGAIGKIKDVIFKNESIVNEQTGIATIDFDSVVTKDSDKLITSGAVEKAIEDEQIRTGTVETNLLNKINENDVASLTYGNISRNITLTKGNGNTLTANIPLSTTDTPGLVSPADVSSFYEMQSKLDSLELGGVWRKSYNEWSDLISEFPLGDNGKPDVSTTQWEKQDYIYISFDENRDPENQPQTSYIVVVNDADGTKYLEFRRIEGAPITRATNTDLGVFRGSLKEGQVYIESDSTGSLVGYDQIKTDIANLIAATDGKVNTAQGSTNAGMWVATDDSGNVVVRTMEELVAIMLTNPVFVSAMNSTAKNAVYDFHSNNPEYSATGTTIKNNLLFAANINLTEGGHVWTAPKNGKLVISSFSILIAAASVSVNGTVRWSRTGLTLADGTTAEITISAGDKITSTLVDTIVYYPVI